MIRAEAQAERPGSVNWYNTTWPERVAIVTASMIPAEARCWRIALPRRRDKCSLWYLDTVVDNGRAAISAKNRNSSRFNPLPGGTGMESETFFDLFM